MEELTDCWKNDIGARGFLRSGKEVNECCMCDVRCKDRGVRAI